ncbi:hypothetical protein KY285_010636 [Solanum tuberosum]|nr:hypothetical protein KY285_010636 [Solanum tuberosum]
MIRTDLTSGESSPHYEEHLIAISSNLDGGIDGNTNSDQFAGPQVSLKNNNEQVLDGKEGEETVGEVVVLARQSNLETNAPHQVEETHSANSSFGIQGTSNLPTPIPILAAPQQEHTIDHSGMNPAESGNAQLQMQKEQTGMVLKLTSSQVPNDIVVNQLQVNANETSSTAAIHEKQGTNQEINKNMEDNTPSNIQKHTATVPLHQDRNMTTYHSNFPKISNNFEKHNPPPPKTRNGLQHPNQSNDNIQSPQSHQNSSKKEHIPAHAPFTVTQSFAAKLRQNQNLDRSIGLTSHDYTTRQDYSMYCRHQGHPDYECYIKKRDEEYKKRRESEMEKRNKDKPGQEHVNKREQVNQNYKEAGNSSHNAIQHQQREQNNNQQEDQWKMQRRKNNRVIYTKEQNPKDAQGQTAAEHQQHNQVQDQPNLQDNQELQIKEKEKEPRRQPIRATKEIQESNLASKNTGIDLILPAPNTTPINSICVAEVDGGMYGGNQEKITNLQEGVSKRGRLLTHVLHERVHTDLRPNLRAPATSTQDTARQNYQQNQGKKYDTGKKCDTGQLQMDGNLKERKNEASGNQGNTSKKTGQANTNQQETGNKHRLKTMQTLLKNSPTIDPREQQQQGDNTKDRNTEYDVIQSEDEFDPDTHSIEEEADDEEETNKHLIKAFGSTFQSEFQEEIQEIADQQGLSPRRRRQSHQ